MTTHAADTAIAPAVAGLAHSHQHAAELVVALKRAGIPQPAISIVAVDGGRTAALVGDGHPFATEAGAAAGAAAVAGSALAWLVALGAVVIPGGAAVVAIGPLHAALAGAAAGAASGGIAGALAAVGLTRESSSYLEEQLGRGRILIVVQGDAARRRWAHDVLRRGGAHDLVQGEIALRR